MSDLSAPKYRYTTKEMIEQTLIIILAFAFMMTSNSLANILPINGYSTGAISALFPNYFVPAGFTFSIWGIIYLLLFGWLINSVQVIRKSHSDDFTWRHVRSIKNLFLYSCLLNGCWIFAWHYLQVGLSVLIMLVLLYVLVRTYLKMQTYQSALTGFTRIWLYHSMVVYLAWICVATIANITALLVHLQWTHFEIEQSYWSILMILIAFLLGCFFAVKKAEPAFLIVLAWAFYGISKGQEQASMMLGRLALVISLSCLILMFYAIWKRNKDAAIDGVL